jgi:Hydantoinase/oxoprolinase N-terminal region
MMNGSDGCAIGVDVGDTDTDVQVFWNGRLERGKALTDYADFSRGLLEAIEVAAGKFDVSLHKILQNTETIFNATTVVTNAISEFCDDNVGVLVTAGFKDTSRISGGPPDHARAAYRVVCDDDGTVEERATTDVREPCRRKRIGTTPAQPLRPPRWHGVSVIPDDAVEHWVCGHCRYVLCRIDEDWRVEGSVTQVDEVGRWMRQRSMAIHVRATEPRVLVTQHYCPACAASLHTDVLPEGVTYQSPQLKAPDSAAGRSS